jgi:hypothetical protein
MMTRIARQTILLLATLMLTGSLLSCSQERKIREHTIVYEDPNPKRIDDSTSIVFDLDDGAMRFYPKHSVDYTAKQFTEFATEFVIKTDGDVYFDDATQILVPKTMPRESWRGFGQVCKAEIGSSRVECASEKDGGEKHSFTFDDRLGVTEFSHPCPSFSKNECTYRLVSTEGIFSRSMRQRVR